MEKIGVLKHCAENLWFDAFRFRDHDGIDHAVAVPSARAMDGKALIAILRDLGAQAIPRDKAGIRDLANNLTGARCGRIGIIVFDGGWIGIPGSQFSFRGQAIHDDDEDTERADVFVASPTSLNDVYFLNERPPSGGTAFALTGTIDGWNGTVGECAKHSSVVMLAIGAAFTAPTLALQGRPIFGINIVGPSSIGKTTAILAAGSVLGIGDASRLSDLNITEAHLEGLAAVHRDQILPVDDISTVRDGPLKRFEKATMLAYNASGRGGLGRNSKVQRALTGHSDRRGENRVITMTSSEYAIHELALLAGRQVDGGQEVRLLEIPVPSIGTEGVFNHFPKTVAKGERRRYASEYAGLLRSGAKAHQGVKMQAWLEFLTARGTQEEILAYMRTRRDRFMKGLALEDGRQIRHAEHFATLYAGGALAIRHKHLPWTRKAYFKAIRKCYRASAGQLKAQDTELNELAPTVIDWLRTEADIQRWPKARRSHTPAMSLADGWRKPGGKSTELLIRKDRLKNRCGSASHFKAIERRLIADNVIAGPAVQTRIPGFDQRPYLYRITLPEA